MRLVVAAALAALAFLAAPHELRAQPRSAVPPSDDMEAAKAHFAAGSAYYDQANYADAVKEFNEAYRLSKRIDLLYNIAVCYERLAQYDSAIQALQKYLTDKPDAPDRVTIQSRIGNLEKRRDENGQPPPAMPPPTPPPFAPRTGPNGGVPGAVDRPAHWYVPGVAVGAGGVAILLASLGTGLGAHAIHDDLVKTCLGNVCEDSQRSKVDEGKALALASDVLLGVGAAATVAGAILLIVQSRHPATHRALVTPSANGVRVSF